MSRPRKERNCNCPFRCNGFKPVGIPTSALEKIYLQLDELEALQLCDLKGMTQEDTGLSMQVSRGTVQRLLITARAKVVRAIVDGCALIIEQQNSSLEVDK